MLGTVKISVVIPAWNAAGSIERAVRSALAQSLRDLEVIIVDDGSTDETVSICDRLGAEDKRVRLIVQTSNGGVSAARNTAISSSGGRWIALLDADDEFVVDRLERLEHFADVHQLDLAADNLLLRSEKSQNPMGVAFTAGQMETPKPLALCDLLLRNMPHDHAWGIGFAKPIMRRAFLSEQNITYCESIRCAEDFLLYAQCIMRGGKFKLIDYPGYVYSAKEGGHGTAFNLTVSDVNRLISEEAKSQAPLALSLLRRRQRAIDCDAFQKSAQERKLNESFQSFRRLPVLLAMAELMKALIKALKVLVKSQARF